MITPKITGTIITSLVIILGVVLLLPALMVEKKYTIQEDPDNYLVLLTFNIVNSSNLPSWCYDLSRFLENNDIHSTVFMTGIIADTYPQCVSSFSSDTDIGSMSYSYENVTSISTYPRQLSQIAQGKMAIDTQGKFNSTAFRAPYGSVDDNIYSLLSRSHILADFSYQDHYNIFTDGRSGMTFYRNPMTTIPSLPDIQDSNATTDVPVMINFYNYDSVKSVENIINSSSELPLQFVSVSELAEMNLTKR